MSKKKSTFFADFKTFITRGNVIDMAVGVIVGGAFTAIVNSVSNNILKPVINWVLARVLGKDSLSEVYTFLQRVDTVDESGKVVPDLAESIYIDWGAFINAIINFLLIAFVLFCIVKTFNSVRDNQEKLKNAIKSAKPTKAEKAEMKALGLNYKSLEAVKAFRDEKAKAQAEAEAQEKAAAEEAARVEAEKAEYARGADDRQEALLREIVELLKKQ